VFFDCRVRLLGRELCAWPAANAAGCDDQDYAGLGVVSDLPYVCDLAGRTLLDPHRDVKVRHRA
jgi:hypothetical protein